MAMDVVDDEIRGGDMQYAAIELDAGGAAVGKAGSLFFMADGGVMAAVFGDGRGARAGPLGRLLGAGRRLITGGSLFITVCSNAAWSWRRAAFAAPCPGKLMAMNLRRLGVRFDIRLVGKVRAALFGGEGLFLARLSGPGAVWLQGLRFSRLASRVFAAAPQTRGGRREEGGLGGLLGDLR